MKPKLTFLKQLSIFCASFAATAAFGQTTQIWTGGNGTGTAIGAGTNWLSGASPNSANGDICQWDGTVPGNLFLTSASANGNFNNGTPGVSFHVTSGHTGSWTLSSLSPFGSANIALNAMIIDSGAGAYSLGDSGTNVLNIILRPSSSGNPIPIHLWSNNSTNPATVNPNVRYQSGGGNPHAIQVDGTGNWFINNALNNAGGGNNNNFLIKTGPGTMFWNPFNIAAAAGVNGIGSPIDIEGGSLVLAGIAPLLGSQRVTNNGIFQYAVNTPATWSGPFNGTNCTIVVSAGTLTLSSTTSDFKGHIIVTSGGVLNVGGNQNAGGSGPLGTNGPISFNGGTLQFSVANTFDYSPRFDTAAGQAYSIDTQNQNVTLTNALTSSGGKLTKLGSGMLTLGGANTYTGPTAVNNGTLVVGGPVAEQGELDVEGGTLISGGVGVVATNTVAANLNIDSGSILITLNKSLLASNTTFVVGGSINSTGGTLVLTNLGPTLAVGDQFFIFNQPLNGKNLMIQATGFSVTNNLAVDGSVTVTSVVPVTSPKITATYAGGVLSLTWAAGSGLHLQAQTNSLAIGLSNNWVNVTGGTDGIYSATPNPTAGAVYYRLDQ